MSACCPAPPPGGEHAALEAVAAELDAELAGDPTLQGCCRQDLEDQASAARLRAQLSLKDPSRERQRLAAHVIRAPPPGAGSGSDLESDDEDATLGELGLQRGWPEPGRSRPASSHLGPTARLASQRGCGRSACGSCRRPRRTRLRCSPRAAAR